MAFTHKLVVHAQKKTLHEMCVMCFNSLVLDKINHVGFSNSNFTPATDKIFITESSELYTADTR